MYILLTNEIVEFEMPSDSEVCDLDTLRVRLSPVNYTGRGVVCCKQNQDMFLSLLRTRCTVSNRTSSY